MASEYKLKSPEFEWSHDLDTIFFTCGTQVLKLVLAPLPKKQQQLYNRSLAKQDHTIRMEISHVLTL